VAKVRSAIPGAWWRALGSLGLTQERWNSLDPVWRRAIKVTAWTLVGVVVIAVAGVFKPSLLLAAVFILALVIPPWERMRAGRYVGPAAVLVLAALYPFYIDSLFQWPIFGPFPAMDSVFVMLIYVIMALGLNIVVGYAGLLDLGYVAFYAIGAYTVGWFASQQFAHRNFHVGAVDVRPQVPGIHVSIWVLLAVAGLLALLAGIIIGFPTLRLRGDYLAIVTLGFGEIVPQVANNGDHLFGTGFNLTGGTEGLTALDTPGFGHTLDRASGGWLPANFASSSTAIRLYFWTALALVLFTVFCSYRLRDSRIGRAWIAIREDEIAAAAMGVPLMRVKTWAYALGAFFGGMAGAFYASWKTAAFPNEFMFNFSVFILCMVILGGMGSIWGVVVGALFLSYLDREGLSNIGAWMNAHLGPGGQWANLWNSNLDIPKYEFGIFGLILVVVMLLRPEGLIPSSRRKIELREDIVHEEPLYDAAHGERIWQTSATKELD
jgi:branched-chain amino acid transport system permease protein